jgi:hypothetical protein
MLESALALKVKGLVCGESTGDLLARYDPDSSSWRTSQACLVSGWEPFSETFPRSGMMLSGTVYQLPPSAHVTDVTEFGLLLPTPIRRDYVTETCSAEYAELRNKRKAGKPLSWAVRHQVQKYWPTPSAGDDRDRGNLSTPAIQRRAEKGKQLNLSMVVSEISGALNPEWVEALMGFPIGWTVISEKQ